MTEERLSLTDTCAFVRTVYATDPVVADVDLEYVERSNDPWYSNTETVISINEDQAREIVDFLTRSFNL